jgi:PhnB protein
MSTPIPEFNGVTPHLIVRDANAAIEFYQNLFKAELLWRNDGPDGRVWIAALSIDGGMVLLADEFPEFGLVSPATIGGPSVTLHLYVDDVEHAVGKAIAAGMEAPWGVKEMHWGDDYSQLNDPFGHKWAFATRRANYSPDELKDKEQAFFKQYKHEIDRAETYAEEWHEEHPHALKPNVPPKRETE